MLSIDLAFIEDSSSPVIVVGMAEKEDVRTAEEEKDSQEQPQQSKPWTLKEFGGKPVWDWLQLLIVPLMLALITVVFTWQQDVRQQRIENQRAQAERELADQRAQDEALQAYLGQMSSLLLENDLRESEKSSEERTLARARTLAVLGRLDAERKTAVMQFLIEAKLVQRTKEGGPLLELEGADLQNANLSLADLTGADLSEADLRHAALYFSDLIDGDYSKLT